MPNKQAFLADKTAFDEAMVKLTKHLNTNYYIATKEWHYGDIEPRVFAEELLGADLQDTSKNLGFENDDFQTKTKAKAKSYKAPDDYKFHCFNSYAGLNSPNKTKQEIYIQVDTERFTNHTRTIFDTQWQKMPFTYFYPLPSYTPTKPQNLAAMLKVAKVLSIGYVRVDLYSVDGRVMVGELTFTSEGGTGKFTPNEWDKKFGEMWG